MLASQVRDLIRMTAFAAASLWLCDGSHAQVKTEQPGGRLADLTTPAVGTEDGSADRLRMLDAARRAKDWGAIEALSIEAFDAAKSPTESLFWLSVAAEAKSQTARTVAQMNKHITADPTLDVMRSAIQDAWTQSSQSAGDLDLTARGLQHLATCVGVIKGASEEARWIEEAGDLVASAPVASQRDLAPGYLPDEHYFRAAALFWTAGQHEQAVATLTRIDSLTVRRQTSSFHAANLHDVIRPGNTVAAYRFARDWMVARPTEQNASLVSRVASSAIAVADTGDRAEMLDAYSLLTNLPRTWKVAVIAGDQIGLAAHSEAIGLARPLHVWEREVVSSQILYSRVILAHALRDVDASAIARDFLARFPDHPASPSVAQLLKNGAN